MTGKDASLAMRELRTHLGAPFVLAAQAGIALVLGLSGPFATYESLPLVSRLAYWTGVVFGTYAIGTTITLLALDRLDATSRLPFVLRILRGGALVGLCVILFLVVWNLPFFGWRGVGGHVTGTGVIGAFVVSCVVLGLRALYPDPVTPGTPRSPALLQRLPLEKRGALIALSATDHYVEIVTNKGRELVLMRLSDAISETEPTRGVQVHRSHWIALDRVQRVMRHGDGARLDMGDGLEIPVSRRHMTTIRAAGLLPLKQG